MVCPPAAPSYGRRASNTATNWEGRRLQNARFTDCRFHGIRGRPVIEGSCTIERPNLASGDDEEIGTAEQVLKIWMG